MWGGLHAQHHHAARARARGRHRHRRRHRRAREHLPATSRRRRRSRSRPPCSRRRRSASPSSRPRSRSWRSSSRSRSWAASSAASSELRPHDGVRDRASRCSSASRSRRCCRRAGCKAHEPGQQAVARRAHRRRLLPADRARLHGRCSASSMRHRWVVVLACVAALGSCVPLGSGAQGASSRRTTRRSSRLNCARRRARASPRRASSAERIARDIRELPGVTPHARHRRRRRREDAEPRHHLRAASSIREKREVTQNELMDRMRKEIVAQAAQDPAHRRRARSPTSAPAAFAGAEVQYTLAAPTSTSSSASPTQAHRASSERCQGAVDVDSRSSSASPSSRV